MPTRIEQLLADPEVRALPAHLREPLFTDAIAADEADSRKGTYQRPQRVGEPQPATDKIDPGMLNAAVTAPAPVDPLDRIAPMSNQIYAPTNEGNYVLQNRPQPQQLEPGLEETFTKPSEMVPLLMTGPATALGARAGTRLASELTNPIIKTAAPYVGAAAGSEAANVTGKVMSGQSLTPDMSDALAVGVPLATGAWPTTKAVTGQYALKTQTGKQVALENAQRQTATRNTAATAEFDAARAADETQQTILTTGHKATLAGQQETRDLVTASNASLKAQFEAAKAADEASQAVHQSVFKQQMNAHQALLDFQKAEKDRYATQLRQFVNATREGDHTRATQLVATLPDVPTEQAVKKGYTDVVTLATQNNVAIVLPEVQKLKRTLLDEAERLRKLVPNSALADTLESMGKGQKAVPPPPANLPFFQAPPKPQPLDLVDVWEGKKLMRAYMSSLAQSEGKTAGYERRLYGRFLDAIDKDIDGLAGQYPKIQGWQSAVDTANALNLKHETVKELQGFLTSNLLDINPATGEAMFNAGKFLRAIEQDSNAQLKGYMQKTTFPQLGNKSLYDLTQENFKQYVKDVYGGTESLRQLRKTGGVTVPPEPSAPTTGPALGPVPQQPMPTFPQTPAPAVNPQMAAQPNVEAMPQANTRPDRWAVVGDALTRLGLAGSAGYMYSQGYSYPAVGVALGAAAGLPQLISHFFLSDAGQKTLLKIMTEYGGKMTPEAVGFLTAASRASVPTAPASPPQ